MPDNRPVPRDQSLNIAYICGKVDVPLRENPGGSKKSPLEKDLQLLLVLRRGLGPVTEVELVVKGLYRLGGTSLQLAIHVLDIAQLHEFLFRDDVHEDVCDPTQTRLMIVQ